MTVNDIKVLKYTGGPVITFNAEDRTTSSVTATIKPGEPVKRTGTGGNFVQPLATGDPEISTDIFVGIVKKESTEDSTNDGTVDIQLIIPGTIIRDKATTVANIDTAAKLLGIQGDYVAFDVTASSGTNGIFTIDEDEADDPNVHGLCILTGDINKGTLDVITHINATLFGSLIGQTMD